MSIGHPYITVIGMGTEVGRPPGIQPPWGPFRYPLLDETFIMIT